MASPTVLLTGATGFIGARLIARLRPRWHVWAVARQPPRRSRPDLTWLKADLGSRDSSWLPPLVETVIYTAQSRLYRDAQAGAYDMFDINVAGLKTIIDAGLSRGLRRVVYLSTASVYAQSADPISETGLIAPESYYAHSKRMAELLLESYGSQVECCVLRVFTAYGVGQRDMLVPRLVERVGRGETLYLDPAGALLLSPVYVDDVCRSVELLIEPAPKPGSRVFNVGGPEVVSVERLATLAGTLVGREPVFENVPSAPPVGWAANTQKMRRELGWAPQTTIEDGLALTVSVTGRPRASHEVGSEG